MTRLKGHFDGQHVILDEPAPPDLKPNTEVQVVVVKSRDELIREWATSVRELWERPLPEGFQPTGRTWKREDLYERGRRSDV